MRVLLVGSHLGRVDQTEACLERALRQAGCEVLAFDYRASAWVPRGISKLIPAWFKARFSPRRLPAVERADARESNRRFLSVVSDFRPGLVLALRADRLEPESIESARAQGAAAINWTGDEPWRFVRPESVSSYDLWAVYDRTLGDWLLRNGARRVEHLPVACDPELHRPVELSSEDRRRWASKLCFVGSYSVAREKTLAVVAGLGLAIWGPGWDRASDPAVRRCVRGSGALLREEWLKAYAAAEVVLNIHGQGKEGLNLRVWETLATGSCLVSDYMADFDRFLPGVVETFRNPEELRVRCGSLLADAESRKKMARAGRELVLSRHTFLHRLRTLLRWTEECRALRK